MSVQRPVPGSCRAAGSSGGLALSLGLWAALASALGAQDEAAVTAAPFRAKIRSVFGADLLVTEDGRRLRLQGISLPAPAVRPRECVEEIREVLRVRLVGHEVWVFPETGTAPGDDADSLVVVRGHLDGASVNEELLERGLALFSCQSSTVRELSRLQKAARRAQAGRRGWFGRAPRAPVAELPYLHGASLGLHYQDPELDYHRQLDELAAAGFRHVSLLLTAFVADVEQSRIDWHHRRTVRDERLGETIRYARDKGMTVMLLPIVLLERAGEDDWRGTLRPDDERRFWLEYDRFLSHYLDIAESTGVEVFCVGSELSSLEDRTESWRRLIGNARGRFTGLLTYSANWDHVHVPRFFDALDFVGVTGYFELTAGNGPSEAELRAAWHRVASELGGALQHAHKPVVLTELGYCSRDGANKKPWDYVADGGALDLQEQADCFAAFLAVAKDLEWLRGAYWYEYFEAGGPADTGYSPRGKPAMALWREWARSRWPGVVVRNPGR